MRAEGADRAVDVDRAVDETERAVDPGEASPGLSLLFIAPGGPERFALGTTGPRRDGDGPRALAAEELREELREG